MSQLENSLRRCKMRTSSLLGAPLLAALVFAAMALTQLNLEYTPPQEQEPIAEYYIPPPPPPPAEKPPEPKKEPSIAFDLPVTHGPGDLPLGFLQADFGLSPEKLAKVEVDVDASISAYKTDGLESLKIYDFHDVAQKPERVYQQPLNLPSKLIGRTSQPVSFVVLYTVTKKGRATNVQILDCPYPEAIPRLRKYIESWRLEPAIKDGKPVNCWVQHRFTYHPSSGGSPFSL